MAFFPFDHLIYRTSLSPATVRQRISDIIEPTPDSPLHPVFYYSYKGWVKEGKFKIQRIIDYRNSFLPVIKGIINTEMGETVVNITMRPQAFVSIFMFIWLGAMAVLFLFFILCGLLSIGKFYVKPWEAALIPAVMFSAGYFFFTSAFKNESNQSKTFFKKLFEPYE